MTDDVQIIDDFLSPNEFEKIEHCLMKNESFPDCAQSRVKWNDNWSEMNEPDCRINKTTRSS